MADSTVFSFSLGPQVRHMHPHNEAMQALHTHVSEMITVANEGQSADNQIKLLLTPAPAKSAPHVTLTAEEATPIAISPASNDNRDVVNSGSTRERGETRGGGRGGYSEEVYSTAKITIQSQLPENGPLNHQTLIASIEQKLLDFMGKDPITDSSRSRGYDLKDHTMLESVTTKLENVATRAVQLGDRSNIVETAAAVADTAKALAKTVPFLGIAQQATASLLIVNDYLDAAAKIQPLVDAGKVNALGARDYAAAMSSYNLLQNATMHVNQSIGAEGLIKWVNDHPDIPTADLDKLGLGGIQIIKAPEQEMS